MLIIFFFFFFPPPPPPLPYFSDKRTLVPSLVKPLVSNDSYTPASTVDKGVELAVPGAPANSAGDKEMSKPKPPSKDAPIRWFSLLVYAAVMIPIMIVLVILVAI